MRTIDGQDDFEGYPECELEELEDVAADEVSQELELLARCVHAARFAGA